MSKLAGVAATLLVSSFVLTSALAAGFPKMELKPIWTNVAIQRPIWFCEAPDGTRRKFVVEQRGRILILPEDQTATNATVFLDISDRKSYASNEEGLLGFAFHPRFKANGKFYIYYSPQNPRRTVVSEFQAMKGAPDKVDLASERVLFEQPQPYPNHKGGCIIFGPDGFLYISLGDGGSANDPHDNGQNLKTTLGKIIRIDVDSRNGSLGYGIPEDNPFAGKGGGVREEIWAYGLRNVWRFSFDRQNGDLWAADVGQNKFEEVHLITKGGNYGWNWREGFHPFKTNGVPPADAKFVDPIIEYPHMPAYDRNNPHGPGLSITGGYVYRGEKLPSLHGAYVYADFSMGTIWALRQKNGKVIESAALYSTPKGTVPKTVSSFGEDLSGELYVLVFEGTVNGRICELEQSK
jgi:glucose/arabinose dehydrogenase